jgi:hypothetical protein
MVNTSGGTPGPSRSARQELVKTLVEQSWARPDALRPTARPHIVLMAAIAAAAVAVAVGALIAILHKSSSGSTAGLSPLSSAASVSSPSPALSSFTAVSGWDCGSGTDYGFVAQGRTSSWHTVASGGWAQDGCHGQFESIPMTGSKTTDDPNQYAEWWFTPPAAMTRCAVSVFRPAAAQRQDSAASAAQFFVLDGLGGSRLAGFVLNEAADPGSWAAAGSFPVSQNGIAVELVDRGVPAFAGARLAITQVKVVCTA